MTIDEAITRYNNNAEYERTHGNLQGCLEFRQLVEWLEQLRKQEPCEDAISRQTVIDVLKDTWNMFSDANDAIQESIDTIEALLSVTPQRPKGKWIDMGEGFSPYECSKCGGVEFKKSKYCPNCGAKMEVEG